jgi:hypothetical protein
VAAKPPDAAVVSDTELVMFRSAETGRYLFGCRLPRHLVNAWRFIAAAQGRSVDAVLHDALVEQAQRVFG